MIYYIPIEPLEERYTEQWYRWFPEEFKRQKKEFTVIDGETLTNVIETGTFLDVNSTLFYKSEQLKKVATLFFQKKVKDGDVFFVADIEFWGIESIRYLAVLNGIKVKIYGFCHAGSYTKEDYFEKTSSFAQYYEHAWGQIFDLIFVGSKYHKNQLVKLRNLPEDKISVSGNPYNVKDATQGIEILPKKDMVILSNRPDYEKRPNLTLDVFNNLKQKHPEWEFIVTTSRKTWGSDWIRDKGLLLQEQGVITIHEGLSKKEYFQLLQQSKVMSSNSIEENFGFCILEAIIFMTIPVLPKGLSHDELVESKFLFNNIKEQIDLIEDTIINYNSINKATFNIYPLTLNCLKNIVEYF